MPADDGPAANAATRIRLAAAHHDEAFAAAYGANRPEPPGIIVSILARLAQADRLRRVVDLRSGTGLSTRLWKEEAEEIIGIEPDEQLRRRAEQHPGHARSIIYRPGYAHDTGLLANSADVVTCAQALHWLEPDSTFAEVARLLRSGGVFAAYDYDPWPVINADVGAALESFRLAVFALSSRGGVRIAPKPPWPRESHGERLRASGHFRLVREVNLHHVEMGDAARLLGLVESMDGVARLRQQRVPGLQDALGDLRGAVQASLGAEVVPWFFSYQMWVGIK